MRCGNRFALCYALLCWCWCTIRSWWFRIGWMDEWMDMFLVMTVECGFPVSCTMPVLHMPLFFARV